MKKRTLFTLIFAIVLIIASGISSLLLFKQLSVEREKNTINKTYPYDNSEELVINVENSATLNLSASSNDDVQLTKESTSYQTKQTDNTDWSIEKKDKQTIITIDNKQGKQDKQAKWSFYFSFLNPNDFHDNYLFLSIPQNYKKITINGTTVDVYAYDFNLNSLNLKVNNSDVSIYSSAIDNLAVENTDGKTQLQGSHIKNKASIDSSSGFISVSETSFSDLAIKQATGDVSLDNTKGNITITSKNGNINVTENKGVAKLDTQNGDITYSSFKTYGDIVIESLLGDIQIGLGKEAYKNDKVNLETHLGDISIFDDVLDDKNTFSKNTGSNSIKATSTNGDITIYEADDYNMNYEYE